MKFSQLAQYIEKIEKTSSRLSITHLLADLFKKLSSQEIEKTVYLLQGRICPIYQKIEFGIAEKMVIEAAILAFNIEKSQFNNTYKKIGDLGKTVEYFKKEKTFLKKTSPDILAVYQALYKTAIAAGEGSQEVKINSLASLIGQVDPLSARYLVRIPIGVMRLGFSDMTILDAYSWMLKGDKSLRPVIEKAYHVRPDLGFIGRQIKQKGIDSLTKIGPKIFTPILMMKAERLTSAEEIIEKIGRCAIEPKYDGFRLQVHYKKSGHLSEVKLYSRNLEEVSFMYPDIIAGVKKEITAKEIIFEGEAIGFNPQTEEFLPFQETVQRKRKYGIEEKAKEIPLKLFAFELLYLNGKNYINAPFIERREKLTSVIKQTNNLAKNILITAPEKITDNIKELEILFDDAVSKGLEGIMAKKLDGIYQPGARGWNWIKFKRSYSSKIEDTIDCLIMGYDYGKGKRASFGIGAFLVGVYDEKADKFVTVAKIGTGLSDEEWLELKKRADKYKAEKKPAIYEVDKQMSVDVWLEPVIVVEIKADEITRSPVHTAGRKMKPSKTGSAVEVDIPGYALRFPRLEKFRDDKRKEEVTTLEELTNMFLHQKNN
ncbi:MAG: ATP-dependent DNA ligase [Microgenomates group bacterium]|nr:ATP-dependent DNA ligase [Microgenomates group bacterium]